MDIEGLLQALPAHLESEEGFHEEVMASISERLDPRTTDYRSLRLSLQELARSDVMFLAVSEMMAIWMTETGSPAGNEEGIALLYWLSGKGFLNAQFNYACAVLKEPNRTKDHAQAFDMVMAMVHVRDLPVQVRAEVQFAIGTCYLEGKGVAQNAIKAAEYLHGGWQAGSVKAAYTLALICASHDRANASGFPPNFRLAAHFLAQAAHHGHARAACDLAQLHLLACAPGSTDEQGAHLLRSAYAAGDSNACGMLKSLESTSGQAYTPERWREIETRALRHRSDASLILGRCGFSVDPVYWLQGPSPDEVQDEVSAIQITTRLVRARARGHLACDHDFHQLVDRMGTASSRRELARDSHLWRRLNIRP